MVSIATTTVSENVAEVYHAGGIHNDERGVMTLTESTVSKNSCQSQSGGIANLGMLTIENSTISENSALYNAGGLGIGDRATVIMLNIVSGSNRAPVISTVTSDVFAPAAGSTSVMPKGNDSARIV